MSVDVKDGWADTTHDVPAEDAPWTLARQSQDACGALQFSVALYKDGRLPCATATDLSKMLLEFAEDHELGEPTDTVVEHKPLPLAAATFTRDEDIVRVWYVSDGASFAKVTYLSAVSGNYAAELADCEEMIRTISFKYAERAT